MLSDNTTNTLQDAQQQARSAFKTVRETRRSARRSYLGATFKLRRAGLGALGALNDEIEQRVFQWLERAEAKEEQAIQNAESRWEEKSERWREHSKRAQERFEQKKSKAEETHQRGEMRLRDGMKLGLTMVKVIGKRVDNMMGDFVQHGQREWQEMEDRLDGVLDRLENENAKQTDDGQIPPFPAYNTMTIEEITQELQAFDAIQLRNVRDYEVGHQNRLPVLRVLDEMLAQKDAV